MGSVTVQYNEKMKVLITGASGFLGTKLVERLYKTHEIVALARNEGKLIELKQKFPKIEIITGDCADPYIVRGALVGVSGVYHLAAFKHVGLAESQPKQCVQSNLSASMILLQCTDQMKLDFIIGISTDKAAQVAGIYGATKLIMEGLFKQFEAQNPKTKYRIVRYGNVLYSTGSVLCKWKKLLSESKEVIITDPDATRFYWTVDQAIDLIFDCLDNAKDSTPYCPEMKAIRMIDLLHATNRKYGTARMTIKQIGLQPGENMHETMDGKTFSNEVEKYTVNEIKELI